MSSQVEYNLKSVKLPRLSGLGLKIFAALIESPLSFLILPKILSDAGIADFKKAKLADETVTQKPIHFTNAETARTYIPTDQLPNKLSTKSSGFNFQSIFGYAEGYRNKSIDPLKVAERVFEAIEDSNRQTPPLRAIIASYKEDILQQAEASAQRIKSGNALSLLDGVPVAIKDELDQVPYPTKVGTNFLGKDPATSDSTVVKRLRDAGALLIGKANMHEIGMDVTGLNPHHGCTRNPYNPTHYTGGSSSGSAAAVATGLCPAAIGADGGGSIRIPSAFCGLVGIKSTYGRISEHGAFPLDWSVAHIGPLAANTTDAVYIWGIIAGPDQNDPDTLHQPQPSLSGWDNLDLSDMKLGIYRQWYEHASSELTEACDTTLEIYKSMGAQIVEIEIPDLELGRVAHLISIAGEMAHAMDEHRDEFGKEHGLDIRISLAMIRNLSTQDYVKATRVRTRLMNNFNQVLENVDAIITPTTGISSPKINESALALGESDLSTTLEIMRYAQPANLTGLPAISYPVGYNEMGLPLGMQAMARAWDEVTLFRLALAAETHLNRLKPQWHYDLVN